MNHYLTLSPRNKFEFHCPVFDADTKLAACLKLRELVWRGQQVEVRHGCQAAMKCSMCPAATIVDLYHYNKNWTNDFHGAAEPKKGKLHAMVLDRIARVIPIDRVVDQHNLSKREKDLLYSSRDRVEAQLKTAPGERPDQPSSYQPPKRQRKTAKKVAPEKNNAILEAAQTGDLAAAINAQ